MFIIFFYYYCHYHYYYHYYYFWSAWHYFFFILHQLFCWCAQRLFEVKLFHSFIPEQSSLLLPHQHFTVTQRNATNEVFVSGKRVQFHGLCWEVWQQLDLNKRNPALNLQQWHTAARLLYRVHVHFSCSASPTRQTPTSPPSATIHRYGERRRGLLGRSGTASRTSKNSPGRIGNLTDGSARR